MPSTSTDRLSGLTTSVAVKAPCRMATTANVTLSGLQTIDGITGEADDRVLVKSQTTASQNAIYKMSSTAWIRALDFDGTRDVVTGTLIPVRLGTMAGFWSVSTTGTITPGTTSLTFTLSSSLVSLVMPLVPMLNGMLSVSVASSALTIAVKTLAGYDPGDDAVYVTFRSATLATGNYTTISITAATSLVVSSGSTLGMKGGMPTRLWIVGLNDAGTFRLGIINAQNIALREDVLQSSTAEGGAGAADSAQIIYTGTAVTSKAMRILGFIEATETTAGTWATAPSKVHLFGPGSPLPGDPI